MLGRFFVFRHPAWGLLCITKDSTWLGWVVLTGVRRVHQISGFAYLDYHATWCRIILLFLFLSHCFFDLIKNSYYLLSMWLCCSPFIIYILITLLTACPLPFYRQTALYCCLPEKSTRENKLLLENYKYLLW